MQITKKASEMNNEEFILTIEKINELVAEKTRLLGFGKDAMAKVVEDEIKRMELDLGATDEEMIEMLKKVAKEELSQEDYDDVENYDKKLVEICKIADDAKYDAEKWKLIEDFRKKDTDEIIEKIAILNEEISIIDAMIEKSLDDYRDVNDLRMARKSIEDSIDVAKKVLASYGCYS